MTPSPIFIYTEFPTTALIDSMNIVVIDPCKAGVQNSIKTAGTMPRLNWFVSELFYLTSGFKIDEKI